MADDASVVDRALVMSTLVRYWAAAAAAAVVVVLPQSVEAKSTRTFSGSSPAEVEKNARKAGFSYPEGEMNCSARCSQRWARE